MKTLNAASAKIRGIEFNANYHPPVNGLTLHGAADFNHVRFGSFPTAPCWGGQTIAQGCDSQPNLLLIDPATGQPENTAQSLSGRPLLHAPKWTANLGFDYEWPLRNQMSVLLTSNTSLSSSYYVDLAERNDMVQTSYAKTDLSVTLRGPRDGWELAFIARNLTDKLTASYCSNTQSRTGELAPGLQMTGGVASGPIGPDEVACSIDRGRALWVQLRLRPLEWF